MDDQYTSQQMFDAFPMKEREKYIRARVDYESASEPDSDYDSGASDVEEAVNIQADFRDGESDEDELEDDNLVENTASDGTKWEENPQVPHYTPLLKHDLTDKGPTEKTKSLTALQVFHLLISDDIISVILKETNRKGAERLAARKAKHPVPEVLDDYVAITRSEFDAFLGLMLHHGTISYSRDGWKDNWDDFGWPIYPATMSKKRFSQLMGLIRFDDGNTRDLRKQKDKAATIRDLFEMLNENLQSCYTAGDSVKIDEQLFPFRGRSPFTKYIPTKAGKYGIQVWWLVDVTSGYPLRGKISTSSDDTKEVVKDLCVDLIGGTGRNLICDKSLTTYELANSLMTEHNLSLLGAVNKKREFIPSEMMATSAGGGKTRKVMSSKFLFSKNVTLCSYVRKREETMFMLSTSHHTTEVSGPVNIPQMILDHSKAKGGTDVMDKKLSEFSCHRRTNRWALAFFCNMLDVAAFAAYTIIKENDPTKRKLRFQKFIGQLARELCLPEIQERSRNSRVCRDFRIRQAIGLFLGIELDEDIEDGDFNFYSRKPGF